MIADDVIKIQRRSMSDPTVSDIDFENKMAWVWTTLKNRSTTGTTLKSVFSNG